MKKITAVILPDGKLGTVVGDVPELKENEVLIRVSASLISPGTEMNLARKRRENPDPDAGEITFGYSNAGVIVQVKGDVKNLKVGMRVAAMGAGAAEHTNYAAVPVNLVVPIPDDVTFEQAAYLSLAATSLQAVRRTEPKLGEYGAVLGLGIVGNLAAQLYRLSGARVLGWETIASRTEIAHRCGIPHVTDFMKMDAVSLSREFASPYGLDFALFAFGGNGEKAFDEVKKCMKVSADGHAMGRIVLVGGCRVPVDGGAASGNLDILASSRTGAGYHDRAWEYGRDYPPAFVQFTTQRNARELIRLIAEKRLHVDPMTTHRIKLENVAEAGDLLIDHPDRALGVILEMSRGDC
ncbi:MAG: Alcohol dehydrogenase [Lentisphaerae bacterium ADurb.Bin242]|nr:MAG: Alcohol dehydrogenase [Lentisphaerae bacterium ADurb.Bin242]